MAVLSNMTEEQEASKENAGGGEEDTTDEVDNARVWFYGHSTPTGSTFKRLVEFNPRNRHETCLYETDNNYFEKMVYLQSEC